MDEAANTAKPPRTVIPPHYWAFISYNGNDGDWAKRLHRFLETYRIPRELVGRSVRDHVVPRRLAPIFLDRDELAGDGNLPARINEALAASRTLIVVCSPYAVASKWVDQEIVAFKRMGGEDRILPLIVAGEPFASENPDANLPECFPRMLRFKLSADGAPTSERSEPLAADARPDKDGWRNACLKVAAGILGVRFDELRRRERERQRRQRLARAAMAALAVLCSVIFYVGLADADLAVPRGDEIRRLLDHFGLSLLRPTPTTADLAREAGTARAPLRLRLLAYLDSAAAEHAGASDAWTTGQVLAALLRDPDTSMQETKYLLPVLAAIFGSASPSDADARRLLAVTYTAGNVERAEPALWIMMALSGALGRGFDLPPPTRASLATMLEAAQSLAGEFHPAGDGGWNEGANQADPDNHFTYTTAIALHMLLETRAAGLPWLGDKQKLDRMIAETSTWLIGSFVSEFGRAGWRRTTDDDKAPDDGITLTIYSALGRACAEAGTELPERVRDAAVEFESGLRRGSYDAADADIRHDFETKGPDGQLQNRVTITRVIRFPWAVQGLVSWRRCARKIGLPPETVAALDRSLEHWLRDLAPLMIADVTRPEAPTFVLGETAYGLASAP